MSGGWATGLMCAFDLETTSQDPFGARIVTACVAVVNATPPSPPRQWLADPGIEIPAETTAIHGITTEHARQHGQPAVEVVGAVLGELSAAWAAGTPVVAYNATYDLTVLDRELQRHGFGPFIEVGPVIDPLVLDRAVDPYRRGKRTLTAACEHYQVRLDGAHDATQDALAAARVAWRIAQKYPQVAALTLPELQAFQARAHAGWAAHFEDYLRSQGKQEVIDQSWPIRRTEVPA